MELTCAFHLQTQFTNTSFHHKHQSLRKHIKNYAAQQVKLSA